ncbi:hypothetical protein G3V96_31250, partial [Escherichia coli]|nr:hypothetical protein [Escherichia coli]
FEQSEVNLNNAQAFKARTEAVLSMVTEKSSAPAPAPAKPSAGGNAAPPVAAKPQPTETKPELLTPQEAMQIVKGELPV